MPFLFHLSVLFTFILLLGTSLANVEACGVTPATVTELIYPTEVTNLHVEPTNLPANPINEDGNSVGHCSVNGITRCGHTSDFSHYPYTTTQMVPKTQAASSVLTSESETSTSSTGSHSTTFVTHKVFASTAVGHATSVTSTSSATYVAKSVSAPVPGETEASASSTTFSKSKTSASTEAPTSALSGYPYRGSYSDKVLYTHNVHRANHSATNLSWDQRLADTAHAWAATCQFRHNTSMLPGGYGQNLAGSAPTASLSQHISEFWYNNELRNFDPYYGQPSPGGDLGIYGHFTQVVWRDTTKVGCATVDCRGSALRMWYTVCNYYPPGNVLGRFDRNVMRPNRWQTNSDGASDLIKANIWY